MSSVFVQQILYYHFDMQSMFFHSSAFIVYIFPFSAFIQKHFMHYIGVHLPLRMYMPYNMSVLLQHLCLIIYCCFVSLDLFSFGASFVLRFSSEPISSCYLYSCSTGLRVYVYIYSCICVCPDSLFINCIFPAVDFKLYTIISFACLQS